MRSFQATGVLDPVPGDVVRLLRRIDRAAGSEARHLDQMPQLLEALRERARVESITASSAIEGVIVEERRIPQLASGAAGQLRDRSEEEFAGYSTALDHLYNASPGGLTVGFICHLHRLLFSFTDGGGGNFKIEDNLVMDRHPDGSRSVRFTPVSAHDTPFFMEELVHRCREALDRGDHPLIVTAAFALDLLCIHPFVDGNGRVARLATTYLLDQADYRVGRYVSLEQLIFDTKDDYYDSLRASTAAWFTDPSHPDVWPWVRYLLTQLDEASRRLADRVAAATSGGTKQDRVRDFVLLHSSPRFTIADIRRAVPGISDATIRLVLTALRDDGLIVADGPGRSASWRRQA